MASYEYVIENGVIVPDTSTTKKDTIEELRTITGFENMEFSDETPQGGIANAITLVKDDLVRNNAYIANQFNDLQKNSIGYYLDDYVMSIKEACSIHSVEYIDLFTCSGLNPRVRENATLYFHKGTDELHPNANGHKRIANIIQARLRNIKPNN